MSSSQNQTTQQILHAIKAVDAVFWFYRADTAVIRSGLKKARKYNDSVSSYAAQEIYKMFETIRDSIS